MTKSKEETRMPVPTELLDLIARFDLHRDAYRSGAYNETPMSLT